MLVNSGKCGCTVIIGSLLLEVFAPGCPTQDKVCHVLAEPPHTHHEFPTEGHSSFTVSSDSAFSGSNTSPGTITVNLSDNMAFWRDAVVTEMES